MDRYTSPAPCAAVLMAIACGAMQQVGRLFFNIHALMAPKTISLLKSF